MALKLYRRHRTECESGHPEDTRSGEFEEGRRGWKKCACLIHVSGTLGGKFNRKQTGKSNWDEAKALVATWETADAWHGKPVVQPTPEPQAETQPKRITIADAVKVFLSNREGARIAPATLRKYRTFTKQLTAFADSSGYVMLDQFTSGDIDVFYCGWNLGARAKGKRLGTLRAFFRFCMNRKWLAENPISTDIKPPIGANRVANKAPYTDDELQRIIDACDNALFHVQMRLPDHERLTPEQWQETADRIEKRLGLNGQPRAVYFHVNDKTGERHMHRVARLWRC
jgi:hypothetical protein